MQGAVREGRAPCAPVPSSQPRPRGRSSGLRAHDQRGYRSHVTGASLADEDFVVRRFFLFRFMVTTKAGKAQGPKIPNPPGAVVREALGIDDGQRVFSYGEARYVFAGFQAAEGFYPVPQDRVGLAYVGKLGRHRVVELGELTARDIVDQEADDWRHSWMVVDCRRQVIGVEVNSGIGSAERLANVLAAGLSGPVLAAYDCRIAVEMLSDPGEFWRVIESSEAVYKLRFELESPNPDDWPASLEAAIGKFKEATKQEVLGLSLENKAGKLEVPTSLFQQFVDYVNRGGGKWWITHRPAGKKEKIESKSTNNAQETPAQIPTRSEPDPEQPGRILTEEIDPERYVVAAVLAAATKLTRDGPR